MCSKVRVSYRCCGTWWRGDEGDQSHANPSQDGKNAGSFCGTVANFADGNVHATWPGSVWHHRLGCSRSLWGSSANMGYESIKKIPLVLLLIEQDVYLLCGLQAGVNLIQKLLQMPICRRGTNFFFFLNMLLTVVVKFRWSFKSISELTVLSPCSHF